MIETATGIVLRTRPFTETSLIVSWLTPTLGRINTVAKGARRPKSSYGGKLDLFYTAEISFSRSRSSDLHTLREVRLLDPHPGIRLELGYLEQASYCAALIEQTTELDTPLPSIYELMCALLQHIPTQRPLPQTIFVFELRLLDELGLRPNVQDCSLKPGTAQMAELLAKVDWATTARVRPSAAQVSELRQFLHGFLIYHLGKVPKGRNAAIGT